MSSKTQAMVTMGHSCWSNVCEDGSNVWCGAARLIVQALLPRSVQEWPRKSVFVSRFHQAVEARFAQACSVQGVVHAAQFRLQCAQCVVCGMPSSADIVPGCRHVCTHIDTLQANSVFAASSKMLAQVHGEVMLL